mmetsp:Transcript_65844/g.177911  ORF Transcript_65844/g.177911 Transcript_65844/m.177911 type:complete len:225 (+) Transcript_65844:1582-2256(+)
MLAPELRQGLLKASLHVTMRPQNDEARPRGLEPPQELGLQLAMHGLGLLLGGAGQARGHLAEPQPVDRLDQRAAEAARARVAAPPRGAALPRGAARRLEVLRFVIFWELSLVLAHEVVHYVGNSLHDVVVRFLHIPRYGHSDDALTPSGLEELLVLILELVAGTSTKVLFRLLWKPTASHSVIPHVRSAVFMSNESPLLPPGPINCTDRGHHIDDPGQPENAYP